MKKQIQTIKQELIQSGHGQLLNEQVWFIPAATVPVYYEMTMKKKMDILMKMILLSIQKTTIKKTEELADMLQVESFFIDALLSKMLRTGALEKDSDKFSITEKGLQQYEEGMVESEPQRFEQWLAFSPIHKRFYFPGEAVELPSSKQLALYRFAENEIVEITDEELQEASPLLLSLFEDDGKQRKIVHIEKTQPIQKSDIVCYEFLLLRKESGLIYPRVWNTAFERWDERLEAQITQNEKDTWQENPTE